MLKIIPSSSKDFWNGFRPRQTIIKRENHKQDTHLWSRCYYLERSSGGFNPCRLSSCLLRWNQNWSHWWKSRLLIFGIYVLVINVFVHYLIAVVQFRSAWVVNYQRLVTWLTTKLIWLIRILKVFFWSRTEPNSFWR